MKQKKSLWVVPFLLLFAAICSTPARADTVIASGNNVTEIDGINVAGNLFDLTFSATATPPPAGIPADLSSLETDLIGDLNTGAYNAADGSDVVILYIDASNNDGIFNQANPDGSNWVTDNHGSGFFCIPGSPDCGAEYGNFTAATPAPEPGSMPLTLTGLGLLGLILVLRKRRTIVLSQTT
jgi:hypothetical protein